MIKELILEPEQMDNLQQCLYCGCDDCMTELRDTCVWMLWRTPVDTAIQILTKIQGPFDYHVLEDHILIIDK